MVNFKVHITITLDYISSGRDSCSNEKRAKKKFSFAEIGFPTLLKLVSIYHFVEFILDKFN